MELWEIFVAQSERLFPFRCLGSNAQRAAEYCRTGEATAVSVFKEYRLLPKDVFSCGETGIKGAECVDNGRFLYVLALYSQILENQNGTFLAA